MRTDQGHGHPLALSLRPLAPLSPLSLHSHARLEKLIIEYFLLPLTLVKAK